MNGKQLVRRLMAAGVTFDPMPFLIAEKRLATKAEESALWYGNIEEELEYVFFPTFTYLDPSHPESEFVKQQMGMYFADSEYADYLHIMAETVAHEDASGMQL